MTDFVDAWDDYSVEFNKKLIFQCKGDLRALDADEQEIASLWRMVVDVYNGGFVQFFCNWGYDCYWFAMRGIQRMGLRELLQLFDNTYMDVFDKFREDMRLKAYWDIPEYFTDEDERILDETDDAFYDGLGEELCEKAFRFYHDELKKAAEFDYLKMWDGFAEGAFRKLDEERGDWSKLSEKEQEIAALWAMFSDIGNGGVRAFFENRGADGYRYAARAIERVGCTEAPELLQETYEKVFPKLGGEISEAEKDVLMEVDTTFWEGLDEKLAEAAFKFYLYL